MIDVLPYAVVMAAVVPLAGYCVTGSWRASWRYTKIWLQVVGGMVALACVMFLLGIAWQWLTS